MSVMVASVAQFRPAKDGRPVKPMAQSKKKQTEEVNYEYVP